MGGAKWSAGFRQATLTKNQTVAPGHSHSATPSIPDSVPKNVAKAHSEDEAEGGQAEADPFQLMTRTNLIQQRTGNTTQRHDVAWKIDCRHRHAEPQQGQ